MIAKPRQQTYPGEAGFTDIYDLPARQPGGIYCRRPFFAEKLKNKAEIREEQRKNILALTKIYLF